MVENGFYILPGRGESFLDEHGIDHEEALLAEAGAAAATMASHPP